jgi:hypothetical protein
MTKSYSVIDANDRRDIKEVEHYVGGKIAKYAFIGVIIFVVATIVSLAVWKPWVTEKNLEIQNTALVNSPQVIRSTNAEIATLFTSYYNTGEEQRSAIVNRIVAAGGKLDWDEILPGNRAEICNNNIPLATKEC